MPVFREKRDRRQLFRETQIGGPEEVMRRRPQVSCGPAVPETPDPVAHPGKVPKVLQCQNLWVLMNNLKFHSDQCQGQPVESSFHSTRVHQMIL